ncbi:MAG: hypothetical protein HYY04_10545 [Chloroflexi bacterium]|nr:hypothetical protein [Chloroflexota bacterium]
MSFVASNWKAGDPIGYINSDVPDLDLPSYRGQRYEIWVPDTLDLQERARLAIHAMTECTDPLADHEIYWKVYFRTTPPQMQHDWADPTVQAKFQEAVPLLRLISGSDQNLHVERKWMEVALRGIGPDGLFYSPVRGRPWAYLNGLVAQESPDGQILTPFTCGKMLSAMAVLALRDGGHLWRQCARRLADGLIELAVDAGEIAFFWPHCCDAARPGDGQVTPATGALNSEGSRVPHGLVHAYRLLGYEPALTLARKLLTYQRRYFYGIDGSFRGKDGDPMAHFHAHSHGLLAMVEYALAADDQELMQFVVRSFESARSVGANLEPRAPYEFARTPGAALVGYFPEWVNSPWWEASELCEVADMIAVALQLSEAGVGDYWDDADRWIRNMFAEGQLRTTDWINRVAEVGLTAPEAGRVTPSTVGDHATTERVAERSMGSFAGWPAANDWYVGNGAGIMHCCTANSALTIRRAWERILRYRDGYLRVNLLLNRASPWADVASHIPYQGRVDVKIKQPVDLSVRIPEWLGPQETHCQIDGEERRLCWEGRYARVGEVKPGNVATLTFAIFERTDVVSIEKQRFVLVRRGNEVVSIEPHGRYHPLYQRDHYRDGTTRWRMACRFVSDESIDW